MTAPQLSAHAAMRVAEFGLSPGVVAEIATRYDVAHVNRDGQSVRTCDRHPDWTVVVAASGVIVTVLRRTPDRWEHHDLPNGRRLVVTYPSADAQAEDDQDAAAPPRRRSLVTRRPSPPRAAGGVVARRVIDPATMASAMQLADGDRRRLVLNHDGSVTVLNHPRSHT